MKIIKFLFACILTFLLTYTCHHRLGTLPLIGNALSASALASAPPLGKFLNPFSGFWQNAESPTRIGFKQEIDLPNLSAPAKVAYDERLVPHIYANSYADACMVQGYVTAQHRLWQMEFQTHFAAGRLAEIIGERGLELDKQQRRKGMLFAAEKSLEAIQENEITNQLINAYSEGVNAYINQLSEDDLPLEYKLLGYNPEPWTPLKVALLGKMMANDLTGREQDLEMTKALEWFGKENLELLFPDYIQGVDPIIPSDNQWDFDALPVAKPIVPDSISALLDDDFSLSEQLYPKPHPDNGSNNWAVSGAKTASGGAILCSDPHLRLGLPSIWYEVQLSTPELNIYGVSLPGAPGIVIGFNDYIAWGVTNAGRDVKDWYKIEFKDDEKKEYKYEGNWRKTSKRKEVYQVKGGEAIEEEVIYTHLGPVVYEDANNPKQNMALRWKAHDKSNDFLGFYYLNLAKNYTDYASALQYYECPAQNFAFADVHGDIAIWQQGKFPLKWRQQGKFLLNGASKGDEWQGYIPQTHNPHIINPARGFVSSANQHPADANYPYYYNGRFEHYRNRRINQQLAAMESITVEDMKNLQNDNYNLQAAEILPTLLSYLNLELLNAEEQKNYQLLQNWNYLNEANQEAPAIYEEFWSDLVRSLWDEIKNKDDKMPYPADYTTVQLLITDPDNSFVDVEKTEGVKETVTDLIQMSFSKAVRKIQETGKQTWGTYAPTQINHLTRRKAFSMNNIAANGNDDAVNANRGTHGPSWRMIVALPNKDAVNSGATDAQDNEIQAWGVYPGGQSGNPGSPFYVNGLDNWLAGDYFRLNFWKQIPAEDTEEATKLTFVQEFN